MFYALGFVGADFALEDLSPNTENVQLTTLTYFDSGPNCK
jgi:hypothetical protein